MSTQNSAGSDNDLTQNCRDLIASVGIDLSNPTLMLSYEQADKAKADIINKIKNKEVDPANIDFDYCTFVLEQRTFMAHDVNSIEDLIDFTRSVGSETTLSRAYVEDQKASHPSFLMWLNFERKDYLGDKEPLNYFYLRPTPKLQALLDEHTLSGSRYLKLFKREDGSHDLYMNYDDIIGSRKLATFTKKGLLPLIKFLKTTSYELFLHAEKKQKLSIGQ